MFHCLPKYLGIIILNKNVLYYLVLLTKNNKLFTAPFSYVYVTNNTGTDTTFNYEDFKDANKILKYMFTWMGHLPKMLGKKNGFTRLYEQALEKLTIERPDLDDEDDEDLLVDALEDVDIFGDEL